MSLLGTVPFRRPTSEILREQRRKEAEAVFEPTLPPGRLVCDACGPLRPDGTHAGFVCRLINFIFRVAP